MLFIGETKWGERVIMLHKRILTFVAAFCFVTLAVDATVSASEIGRVKRVQGDAQIERAGEILTISQGTIVEQSDTIITGAKSRVAMTFIDNSRFSVGPDSRVILDKFEFDTTSHDGAFSSTVQAGSLAIVSGQIAKKTPDAMTIQTPTTILGVRGTKFIVEVDK